MPILPDLEKFRRIVLYDTLIEQMKIEEIEAVLAHEVGHYKLGHIPKRLAVSFFLGLGGFFLLSYFLKSDWFYKGFACIFSSLTGSFAPALVIFSLVLGFFTYWLSPLSNYFSRKHEFEADHFAKNAVGDAEPLISALRKLYVENLSHPLPHSLMYALSTTRIRLCSSVKRLFDARLERMCEFVTLGNQFQPLFLILQCAKRQ